MDEDKFIDTGALALDAGFKILVRTSGDMPTLLWPMMDEGMERLRENGHIGMAISCNVRKPVSLLCSVRDFRGPSIYQRKWDSLGTPALSLPLWWLTFIDQD